jgi:hypothetical protein
MTDLSLERMIRTIAKALDANARRFARQGGAAKSARGISSSARPRRSGGKSNGAKAAKARQ